MTPFGEYGRFPNTEQIGSGPEHEERRGKEPLSLAQLELADPDTSGRLRDALQYDDFALYCQPILALKGAERYPMAEVFVRMREEESALLPPGDFLPVFERCHMMPQLDRWVVRNVIKHLASGSLMRRFTVNVSGQTLDDPEFIDFVQRQLSAANVPGAALAFEVDQDDVVTRLPAATRFASEAKEIGVVLLIDGFCRTVVSFLPIKSLALSYVKVAGSVIRNLLWSAIARTKMDAIMRIARAHGIQVVAEDVEDKDVLAHLVARGVGYAQGFGIYAPHPLESVIA